MNFFLVLEISSAQAQRLAEEEYYRQKMIETIVGLSITAIIVAAPTYWLIRYVISKLRKEFRFKTKFNAYNHIDALILLSMNVLRTNPDCFKEKCIYLKEYIVYLYPEENGSFHESLKMAYTDVYRSESIVRWLSRFQQEEQRKDIVRFLIHMAAQDGVIGSREKAELIRVIDGFSLLHQEWLVLMEDINQAFTRRYERRNESTDSSNYRESVVKNALKYFDIEKDALDEGELRERYRKLVKKYHPDRHPDADAEKRKELEVKFQELQLYYEELLKLL